jgi:hypothetical protein
MTIYGQELGSRKNKKGGIDFNVLKPTNEL